MKALFLLILVQFAVTAVFSQSNDPEIKFRYSDTVTVPKDRRSLEEFLLADGKALVINEEARGKFNFYRYNADLVLEEKVSHSPQERFFPGKKIYTSWLVQMDQRIYYIITLTEGTAYEMFAIEFFPESMDFSDDIGELPIEGKKPYSFEISPDGQLMALYGYSDPIGSKEDKVKELSLLILDKTFNEKGRRVYPGLPHSSSSLALTNDGTVYMTTKIFDFKKGRDLYNGETNFHFEVYAFNPETGDRRIHRIDLTGLLVTPFEYPDLSISPDGAVTVLIDCSRSKKSHDAFAYLRIDPSVENYQLADHIIELPLAILNEGKENNKGLLISDHNRLRIQREHYLFYTSDGNAYMHVLETQTAPVLTNEGSHLYTGIYILRFDQTGKLADITKIPVLRQAGSFPIRLFEVNGHLKILYEDHIDNIAVSRLEDLKRATPDSELANAGNYVLVSATLNKGEIRKQLVANIGNLPFRVSITAYVIIDTPAWNYILSNSEYIRNSFIEVKSSETITKVVYSISVVE